MFDFLTITQLRKMAIRLLVGLCCLNAITAAQGATVQFKSQATVRGDVVRLGDVAEVYDFNPQVAERLQQIILRPVPAAGLKIRMSVDEIRSRLKASGVNLLAIEMRGSSLIEIGRAAEAEAIQQVAYTAADQAADARRLEQAVKALKQSIRTYLEARRVEVNLEQIELEINRQQVPLLTHINPAAYHVQGGQAPWTDSQQLKVSLLDDQRTMQSMVVNVTVKAGPTALVPRYQIPRGQVLSRDDFEVVPVDRITPTMVASYDEIEGKEAAQPLAAGRPVQQTQVKQLLLVRRNAMVRVVANARGIEVSTFCKALREGSRGDVIEVEPQYKKTTRRPTPINVRITGVNEAVVVGTTAVN